MFRPNPAIIRFSSERVSVFIRSMLLCNDGEISSSVVLNITVIETVDDGEISSSVVLIITIIETVDDGEISSSVVLIITIIETVAVEGGVL